MNPKWPKRVRWVAAIAAATVVACVALLTWSYVAARIQAPKDEKIITQLKQAVRQDASAAPQLEAEHRRITAALQQRKQRDDATAIVLLAAAALFIVSAKWLVSLEGRRPPSLERLVQLKGAPKPGPGVAARAREYQTALLGENCPPARRKALLSYRINDNCIGCTLCAQACPVKAIAFRPYAKQEIDDSLCTRCDICRQVCRQGAIQGIPTQ